MSFPLKSLLLLSLVIVGALAANASTAIADFSPASTAFTGTTADPQILYSGGTAMRCAEGSATGRTPARGTSSLSVALTFRSCTSHGFPAVVTCSGSMTLRLTRFDPGTGSGSGTIALDTGFDCTITIPLARCSMSFVGPQANIGPWSLTNATQVLAINANNLAGTDTGGVCSSATRAGTRRGTGTFTATYLLNPRITAS